ncbi:hypothetical protein P3T27_007913 [Kitasatospora sp. MAA19]|nr:hypothetical protein [Kitasatospora sp. MAA19]
MGNTSELDGLRVRVAALKAEVDRLRKESTAARTLAATADRDGTEVRSSPRGRTQVPHTIREERVAQRPAMTQRTEAVGVLISGPAEQTRVLSARTPPYVAGLRPSEALSPARASPAKPGRPRSARSCSP